MRIFTIKTNKKRGLCHFMPAMNNSFTGKIILFVIFLSLLSDIYHL